MTKSISMFITIGLLATSQAAILVTEDVESAYPQTPDEVQTTSLAQGTEFSDTLGNTSATESTLTQTFRVGSTFTLGSITIAVDDLLRDAASPIGISIFEVADTNAGSLVAGANLLTTTTFDPSGTGRSGPRSLTFDFTGADQIALNASVGTEGYAFQLSSTGSNISGGYIDWQRSSGNESGNVYALGDGYDDSGDTAGDFSLSVVAIPEPSTAILVLLGLGVAGFASRKRR